MAGLALFVSVFTDVVTEFLAGASFGDALAGVLRAAAALVLSLFPFDAVASPDVFEAAAVLRVVILLQQFMLVQRFALRASLLLVEMVSERMMLL